jgi:hypothetical protein
MQEATVLILDSIRVIEALRGDRTKRRSPELILFVAVRSFPCGHEKWRSSPGTKKTSSAPSLL